MKYNVEKAAQNYREFTFEKIEELVKKLVAVSEQSEHEKLLELTSGLDINSDIRKLCNQYNIDVNSVGLYIRVHTAINAIEETE